MLSEAKIRELYDRKINLFARTGRDKFLNQIELLEDILEIPSQETDKILSTTIFNLTKTED